MSIGKRWEEKNQIELTRKAAETKTKVSFRKKGARFENWKDFPDMISEYMGG